MRIHAAPPYRDSPSPSSPPKVASFLRATTRTLGSVARTTHQQRVYGGGGEGVSIIIAIQRLDLGRRDGIDGSDGKTAEPSANLVRDDILPPRFGGRKIEYTASKSPAGGR